MKKLGLSGLELFWENIFRLIKLVTGDVKVNSKGTLQKQIDDMSNRVDDCFRNASDGKNLIADAITGKGVPTLGSDTFATIAANIAKIKNIATLQRKTAALNINNPSVTLTPDSGYDGLSQAAVSITLQEKTQSVTAGNVVVMPDTGKVLSKVTVNGPTDRGAWTGQTTDNNNVPIPAGYHNGNGYVSGAGAYNKGVSDADARANANSANYKSGYNAGVSATKRGTAGTGDVLSGKTFTNASSVGASGTMANKGGTTVTAGSVTQDSSYTYFGVPSSGYYSTGSKLRALNSNIGTGLKPTAVAGSNIYSKGMTLKAGNFYAIVAHAFGGTGQTPSTKITYGAASNIHEILKSYRRVEGNLSVWTAHTFILIYVNSDTTLTIAHSNYSGNIVSNVFLLT